MLLKPEDVIFPARVRRQDQIMHDNQSFNKIHANVLGNKRYPRKENYILQRALPQRAG